jgi:DNA primase
MWDLISKYETVITIFDNDEAGMKAVSRYSEKYGINGFVLDLEKDISDSVSRHGKDFVKNELVPLLTECIHTCRRCPESSTSV